MPVPVHDPDYSEILESLLRDLRDELNEPHATDWSISFMVENLITVTSFSWRIRRRLKMPGGSWRWRKGK